MPRHLNSFISVRTYDTSEPLVGRVQDSRKPRVTEVAALDRMAFGELIPATDSSVYDPEQIKCSHCGKRKHYTDFDKNRTYTWRFGRQYECKTCRKQIRLTEIDAGDAAYLRGKSNGRRKKTG